MKCSHVLSIVIEVNQNGAVCLFRSSFKTKQIYENWFSSNFDGLTEKSVNLSKKQNALANWESIKDSILLKRAFKNVMSNSVLIVEAKPVKPWITENIANFQIKLILLPLKEAEKWKKIQKFEAKKSALLWLKSHDFSET